MDSTVTWAEVSKVLASVGRVCAAGDEVTSRKDGGAIRDTKTGAEMKMRRNVLIRIEPIMKSRECAMK